MRVRTLRAPATCAALAAALVAVASRTEADERVSLEWDAPVECPSAGEVVAGVVRMVGSQSETRVRARARVARGGAGYRASVTVETSQGAGERRFEAVTCEAVTDAIELVVALAIDPAARPVPAAIDAGTGAAAPDAAPDAPARAEAGPPPRADRDAGGEVVTAPPPPAPGHALHAALSGLGDTATLPAAALGGVVSVAFTPSLGARRPLRLELRGGYAAAGRARSLGVPRVGGTFALVPLHVYACYMLPIAALELGGCAGGGVSLVPASSDGASAPGSGLAVLGEASAGGLGRLRVGGPVWVRLSLDAALPLTRPSFVVDGVGALHRPAIVSGRGALGLEVAFF